MHVYISFIYIYHVYDLMHELIIQWSLLGSSDVLLSQQLVLAPNGGILCLHQSAHFVNNVYCIYYASTYLGVPWHLLLLDLLLDEWGRVGRLHLHWMHECDWHVLCIHMTWNIYIFFLNIRYIIYINILYIYNIVVNYINLFSRLASLLWHLLWLTGFSSIGPLSISMVTCMAVHMRNGEHKDTWSDLQRRWNPLLIVIEPLPAWVHGMLADIYQWSLMHIRYTLRFLPSSGGVSEADMFFHHVSSPSPGNNGKYYIYIYIKTCWHGERVAEDYKKIKHMMTPHLFGFATSSCTSTSRTCCPRCSECLYPGQRTTIYTCMYTHSTCTLNIHEKYVYII